MSMQVCEAVETISYSQVKTFTMCPTQWRLSRDEEPAFVPVALKFGAAVHDALELFYRQVQKGVIPEAQALVDRFNQSWREEFKNQKVRYGAKSSEAAMLAMGKAMLAVFHEERCKSLPDEIIAVEQTFEMDLGGVLTDQRVHVTGRIDLIEVRSGQLWIVDHKTARSTPGDYANLDQLAIYKAAIQQLQSENLGLKDVPAKARFDVLTKTKNTRIESFPVQISPDLIEVVLGKVRTAHAAMKSFHIYPVRGFQCANCQWKRFCPAEKA